MGDAAESKKAVTVVTFDETTVDDASHKRLHFNWLTLWLARHPAHMRLAASALMAHHAPPTRPLRSACGSSR